MTARAEFEEGWRGSSRSLLVVGAGLVAVAGASPARRRRLVPARRAEEGEEAGRDHDVALDAACERATRSRALTDKFNASQSDVKVTLVNQVTYEDTFTKYKAGLSSGDLPDVVQLQGERSAADDRHADGAPGERVRQGRQVQLLPTSCRAS